MRTCVNCGDELLRRANEAYSQFETRRFCSRRCRGIHENPRKQPNEFKSRYRQVKTPDGRNMLEHRWVMEQHLGRRLETWEQVHHINHDRLDNRVENLEVVSVAEHAKRHTYLPIHKTCVVCGEVFTPHKTKRRIAKTCSRSCLSQLRKMNNAKRRAARNGGSSSSPGAS